ncbi:MAG: hypothetical protein J5827_04110 [Oscillospiraceae bacterium]|nr:hypothetical protein [Oscillospiraceae bacterium]
MNTKKVKNIVIIIFLLVDIAFGALLISDKAAERRHESRTLSDLVEVMEKNGVAFLPESIPENPSLCVLKCGRDLSAEAAIAASLIGECSAQDLGGGLYVYENANGSARFRSNGEFEAVLSDRRGAAQQDIVSDALSVLKSAGIPVNQRYSALENGSVSFTCTVDGTDIFGCSVTLTYSSGRLSSVSGTRPTGSPQYRTADPLISAPTALVRFLSLMSSGGYICTQIEAMDICYFMSVSTSGLCTLQPVWQIYTDAGTFYINAVSGALVSA